MTQMILCSVGVFLGVLYTARVIIQASWKGDIPAIDLVLAAMGWAIFTLGMFLGS